jgi:hypothetical protein
VLRAQRRAIQQRRSAPLRELARWLERPAPPWKTLAQARALEMILSERGYPA